VAILLTDADATLASVGPVASVVVDIVVGLHALVLLEQEDGGDESVSLGDDPDTSLSYRVGAEDAPAVLQGPLVLPAVVSINLTPIPGAMAG
jgi:hypothetical protein